MLTILSILIPRVGSFISNTNLLIATAGNLGVCNTVINTTANRFGKINICLLLDARVGLYNRSCVGGDGHRRLDRTTVIFNGGDFENGSKLTVFLAATASFRSSTLSLRTCAIFALRATMYLDMRCAVNTCCRNRILVGTAGGFER
jgi:hypothetical protein